MLWSKMPQFSRIVSRKYLSSSSIRVNTTTSTSTGANPRSSAVLLPSRAASTEATSRRRLKFDLAQPLTFRESLGRAQEREERKARERQRALNFASKDIPTFQQVLRSHGQWPLHRDVPKILQINIGKLCNLTCRHCHVESGPTKLRENMDLKTVQRCLNILRASPSIETVDITGGAPELNPHFRFLVAEARAMGKTVIDRCNLVVLFESGQGDLAAFLAEHQVNIVASLPCYTEENTDKQRGKRVFDDSIQALKLLNNHGFGRLDPSSTTTPISRLRLDLVYNPAGPTLPSSQAKLEVDYRERLRSDHGVTFTSLLTLANMPIKRFADTLLHSGQYTAYMELLSNSYNPGTVDGLMCRNTVNVAWDGKVYDCDFNAALEMTSRGPTHDDRDKKMELDIWNIDSLNDFQGTPIRIDKHCFGCTAGAGSSCGGALI